MASVAILATCASSGGSGSGGSGGTTTPAPTITVTAVAQSATVSVNLTWTEPANADFLGVTITYTVTGGTASTPVRVAKGTTTHTFTGLTGSAVYTFTVSAVNGSGTLAAGTVSTTTVATATATTSPPLPTIASGASHSCAVDNGRAYCWGLQTNGRLGNGVATAANVSSPVAVLSGVQSDVANTFLTGVTSISAGSTHSCAIANERAYCWGVESFGQLGNGKNSAGAISSPVAVLSGEQSDVANTFLTGVTSISAGNAHSCAIANEQGYCWGRGDGGQLGNGADTDGQSSPVAVLSGEQSAVANTLLTGVTAIVADNTSTCAIANGVAYCWGTGGNGRLGNGATSNQSSPVAVLRGAQTGSNTNLSGVTAITGGTSHSCAIANAVAYCWGLQTNGELGNGVASAANISSPVTVLSGAQPGSNTNLTGGTAMTGGNSYSCAIANGTSYCWGLQTNGRLGNGEDGAANVSSPVAVLSGAQSAVATSLLTGVTTIAGGDLHTCAIANRVAYCWGDGANGRLGNAATADATSPVAVGDFPQ